MVSRIIATVRTISNILIRNNYRLRTVAKTKVQKKHQKPTRSLKRLQMNALADADPETMRISIDTKATVNVGEYSREPFACVEP